MFALDLFIKRTVKLPGLNHIITNMFGNGMGSIICFWAVWSHWPSRWLTYVTCTVHSWSILPSPLWQQWEFQSCCLFFYHGLVSSLIQLILQKTVLLYGMMLLDNLEQYWVPILLSKSWQSEQKSQPLDRTMCITGRVHVTIGLQFLSRERMIWIGKKSFVTFNCPLEVSLREKANNFHFYLPQWSIFGPWSRDI